MKIFLKIFCLVFLVATFSWSLEMALTKSGKKVVLKNDGTWEWYSKSKHLMVKDIREKEAELSISVKFFDSKYYSDMKKMYWDGDGLDPKLMADSIKALPKGGMAQLRINEDVINKNDPIMYSFEVKDPRGRSIYTSQSTDAAAFASDDLGVFILKEIALPKKMKGTVTIIVKDLVNNEAYQFDLPVK